jgi:hypothetical protein
MDADKKSSYGYGDESAALQNSGKYSSTGALGQTARIESQTTLRSLQGQNSGLHVQRKGTADNRLRQVASRNQRNEVGVQLSYAATNVYYTMYTSIVHDEKQAVKV